MKTFIRSLTKTKLNSLWENDEQREKLKEYLNSVGFYVLHGPQGSLSVYAIADEDPYDFSKAWYTITHASRVNFDGR
jgi:hypothetical protein